MKMAFRRKDIKKAYYYVCFLGAKESKGLRGEQYILPVLRQLVNIERRTEPCKVTIQVSNKGIKIIQNVPKKQTLPNGQPIAIPPQDPQSAHQPINNKSSNTSQSKQTPSNATVKMEQIKHFIPHHAVTCALQSEDVVCIILLLYNPLTGCPVHVHGYRCDSIETAFTLRNQLQLLIERPENQRKFAEIETRLAAKGLISHQQLLNNNHVIPMHHGEKLINASNQLNNDQSNGKFIHQNSSTNSAQMIYKQCTDSANRSKRNTLTSDGRSAEDDYNQSEDYSPTIRSERRSEPDGRPSLNKSLVESKSSSGNSSGSSPPPQAPNPVVVEMYENLAAELKAKLGNPQTGPILLPPRDYDTVCRSQGKLIELDQRACTNKLVVGKTKKTEKLQQTKKPDNLVLDTNLRDAKEDKTNEIKETKELKELKIATNLKEKELTNNKYVDQQVVERTQAVESNKTKLSADELSDQARRLNHQRIREQQRQYEQKLKDLQRKQELYEQQQLLIEQQKQVRKELSQQHKPSKFLEDLDKSKSKINSVEKTSSKDELKAKMLSDELSTNKSSSTSETVIHSGGIKQIGSSLANKIKQSLIGSNKEKLQPQLICHKTIHDSLQSLNKLTKNELKSTKSNEKVSPQNLKTIDNLMKIDGHKVSKNQNSSTSTTNAMDTSMSNSSSTISRDLNEKLNTINSRSDSSNVSKSSGIGSGGNLNKSNPTNYDDPQYLSTDEELEDEMMINELSECVDEYMPDDYAYNQYLNDEAIEDLEEEVSNRVVRRMAIRERLLQMEKQQKSRPKSIGERVQTSSEEDDGVNSICYDENLMPKINTAKRVKRPSKTTAKSADQRSVDNAKNAKNSSRINSSIDKTDPQSSARSTNVSSINQIKRSETYYEVNSGQKKMFQNNNFYFSRTNKSPLNSIDVSHQPKLFYFPNPEFTSKHLINSSQVTKQPQLIKYHLGQQAIKQCELRRQKSTPMLIGNNGGPIVSASGSVEKLISNDLKNSHLDKYAQRGRPISMVNMMQSEPFRISHQPIDANVVFKRVPIFY